MIAIVASMGDMLVNIVAVVDGYTKPHHDGKKWLHRYCSRVLANYKDKHKPISKGSDHLIISSYDERQ
ncbi:hypothetical protein BLA29_000924 [Euroglyphus maynei]|uniref:Uncharacterized protein n=1 Tax=Euroglyphus maynei TaxID=6958 RepID=A0A1Y3AT90_EURMA|nr:hypothetical protein BLA29_000924 [Euroglyphus maynei]